MTKKQQTGPSSFCEWIVGTTVQSAAKKVKPAHAEKQALTRGIFRLDLATDDESAEDTLRITYPRTGSVSSGSGRGTPASALQGQLVEKTAPVEEEELLLKKVRFDGQIPKKSALKKTKKTTTIVSETSASESDIEDNAESDTDVSSDATVAPYKALKNHVKSKSSHSQKHKKHHAKNVASSDSESDAEAHPSCKCADCRRIRRNSRKTEEEEEDIKCKRQSQAAHKKSSHDKKNKRRSHASSDSSAGEDTEESGGATTEVEESKSSKVTKASKANQKEGKQKEDPASKPDKKNDRHSKNPRMGETVSAASAYLMSGAGNGDAGMLSGMSEALGQGMLKKGNYPEAWPEVHNRRPNYIEPVRAEVVQTERVIETPHDPPPNAYYDAEHNVIRVYHGPVWGGNANNGLYPRRDVPARPLPMGMPHPLQNPYLGGFNQPGQDGNQDNNMPITQGMPMNAWSAMVPPPGFPQDQNHFGMPGQQRWGQELPGGARAPSSHDKDKAGADNIMPAGIKAKGDKPPSGAASRTNGSQWGQQSTTGSQKKPQGSATNPPGVDDGWPKGWGDSGGQTAGSSSSRKGQEKDSWGTNNVESTWGDNAGNNNANTTWGGGSNENNSRQGGNNSTWGAGPTSWHDNNSNKNAGGSWNENGDANNNNNGGTSWGAGSWKDNSNNNNSTTWGDNAANDNTTSWGDNAGNNTNEWGANPGNATGDDAWGGNVTADNFPPNGSTSSRHSSRGAFAGTNGFGDNFPPATAEDNNIMPTVNMPGAYVWGDPNAAASTKGKSDEW